jgi:hypothetical protein
MNYEVIPISEEKARIVVSRIAAIYGIKPIVVFDDIETDEDGCETYAHIDADTMTITFDRSCLSDRLWFVFIAKHEIAHALEHKLKGSIQCDCSDAFQKLYGLDSEGHTAVFASIAFNKMNIQPIRPERADFNPDVWFLLPKKTITTNPIPYHLFA